MVKAPDSSNVVDLIQRIDKTCDASRIRALPSKIRALLDL